MKFRTPFILLLLSCAVVADDKLPAGNGVLYLGGRPNHIFMIDEATEKVIGDIRLKTGSPGRLNLSRPRADAAPARPDGLVTCARQLRRARGAARTQPAWSCSRSRTPGVHPGP